MATTISRVAMTDDDGTKTTGTIFNNAWLNGSLYDKIDLLFTNTVHWDVDNASAAIEFVKTSSTAYATADTAAMVLSSASASSDAVILSFRGSGSHNNIGIKKGGNNFVIRMNVTGTPVEAISIDVAGLIQYGLPVVALGGGAAPTFGTIGGTGPGTAAQAAWKKEKSSTGAAYYIPVWV